MKLHRKENNCIASAPLEGKTTVSQETRTKEGREGKCIGGLLLEIVLGAVILSFIAMSLYCTRYITYQADDFSYMMWNQSIQDQNPTLSYLHVELWSAWNLYKGWQGTWFTNVLVYLLYGLQSYGIEAFRWTCLIIDLAFFTSLLYLSWELVSFFHTRNRWRWWLFLISVFIWGGLNTVSPAEALYWIDVVIAYTVPFLCGMFGIGQYLHYVWTRKRSALWLAAMLGFLGCGGPLIGTALFCAVYLLICLYLLSTCGLRQESAACGEVSDRGWRAARVHSLPFLTALTGALLNAFSPGNFARHAAETGASYQILHVLQLTLEDVFLRYGGLVRSGFLPGLCAVVFGAALTQKESLFRTKWHPVFLWCYVFFTVYIMIFPFVLAYQLEGYLSDRVGYEVDLAAGILTILCTLYTAEWIKARCRRDGDAECAARKGIWRWLPVCGICALILNLFVNRWSDSMIPNQISELVAGNCAAFCEEINAIYEEIADSEEQDVVITRELPTSRVLKMLDVRDWPEYWANNGIAVFYGKNSVVFEKAK